MSENLTFASFGLHDSLMRAISDMGYEIPTPIQKQAIPLVLTGSDVMGAAQTGTGKTASFGLPLLERLIPLENTRAPGASFGFDSDKRISSSGA